MRLAVIVKDSCAHGYFYDKMLVTTEMLLVMQSSLWFFLDHTLVLLSILIAAKNQHLNHFHSMYLIIKIMKTILLSPKKKHLNHFLILEIVVMNDN
jgi:hypothetical protein